MKKIIIFLLVVGFVVSAFADSGPGDISPSVKQFISENPDPSLYRASCPSMEACKDYPHHLKRYRIKGDAKELFSKLVARSGKDAWSGDSEFQLAYLPDSKVTVTKNEVEQPSVRLGDIYMLDLNILNKVHMAVAFQIVELNRETNTFAFSYLDQNKSSGIQHIQFIQKGEETVIVHQTYFKSDSKFRDAILYRPFHTLLLNDFYDNFAKFYGLELE